LIRRKLERKIAAVLATGVVLSSTSGINVGATKVYAAELPGAHHGKVGDDVFLGGNYIEVGVNKHGSFGTAGAAPEGFHPSKRINLGMVADGDGFDSGNTSNTGDFFLPGSPFEGYVVAYKNELGTVTKAQVAERSNILGITNISTTDTSTGDTLSATTVGITADGKLEITQVVSFNVNDKYFNIHIKYHNISENTIYDARYQRSVDPDQDLDTKGTYNTKNSVISNPPKDGKSIVIAKGAVTDEAFMYISSDSRARAAITASTDPYNTSCYNPDGSKLLAEETTADTWIATTFALGDIAPGESVSFDLINSLNPNVDDALADVGGVEATTPASVEITNEDETLTANLKKEDGKEFTTSASVTYEWYRDGELIEGKTEKNYTITEADKGKNITVKVVEYNIESARFHVDEDEDSSPVEEITTPAAVRIDGTRRAGNTLEAILLDEDGNKVTTSAGVTYEWYRLNSNESENGILVGKDKTYELTSKDKNHYIRLVASYGESIFEYVVGKIGKSSSSGSSSSSSSNSAESSTNNNLNVSSSNGNSLDTSSTTKIEGWTSSADNSQKYIKDGAPVTGWNKIEGSWYLMNPAGVMEIGWKQDGINWYYLKSNGVMATGWQKSSDNWYYFNDTGTMMTGWKQEGDNWYYFKNDGAMATTWEKISDKWYLLKADGVMATGWQQSNGKWYYLYSDGTMALNTTIDGYRLDENGVCIG